MFFFQLKSTEFGRRQSSKNNVAVVQAHKNQADKIIYNNVSHPLVANVTLSDW